MTTIEVLEARIEKRHVSFKCRATVDGRSFVFLVEMPRAVVPDQAVSRILKAYSKWVNPTDLVEVAPWDGFELEV